MGRPRRTTTSRSGTIDEVVAGHTFASRWLRDRRSTTAALVALRSKDGDGWVDLTYEEVAVRVARAATGLRSLGVSPGDRVVLMMRNIPEFHIVDLAVVFCGATPVSIYNSSPPDQVAYLAGHCHAKVAVVEDAGFLERFTVVRDQLPELTHIVALAGADAVAGAPGTEGVLPASVLTDGEPVDLPGRLGLVTPDIAGHDHLHLGHDRAAQGRDAHPPQRGVDRAGLPRPAEDPAGGVPGRVVPADGPHRRAHGQPLPRRHRRLRGRRPAPTRRCSASYLREVHPQTMFGVPRVWEKLHAGVQAALSADPEAKARFDDAVEAAGPIVERRTAGTATEDDEATLAFLDEVAFAKVRGLVGLDALEFAVTGAAPIPAPLIRWYRAIGVPMSEIYGLSETTGPMTWEPYAVKPGTVGRAFPGVEVFLAADGEVCCRGGNVFRRLPRRPGQDGRRARAPTAPSTRATSA